ncbi:Type IV pilus biogenesis protein PilN [Mesobacillus thioparans]
MLVEINLLPKKEHKKSSLLIMAFVGILLLSVPAMIIYFQGTNYANKMASMDKQIESTQKLNDILQAKLSAGEGGSSAVKLQNAVNWAEQYPLDTVLILQKIISCLPERGFIKDFEYSNNESAVIKIQFDASRDAAFYLSSLKASEWVNEVTLKNIIAKTVDDGSDTEISNNTDNQDEVKTLPRYSAEYEIEFKPDFFKENKEIDTKGGDET